MQVYKQPRDYLLLFPASAARGIHYLLIRLGGFWRGIFVGEVLYVGWLGNFMGWLCGSVGEAVECVSIRD